MNPSRVEVLIDKCMKKCCNIPLLGRIVRFPYEKFRKIYVRIRKSGDLPSSGSINLPNAPARVQTLERRISRLNRHLFQQMLIKKHHAHYGLNQIWSSLMNARKVIFTPTELFGFEKLFKNVVFADAEDSNEYKDADCVVFWGHHIDATRANMVMNAEENNLDVFLMEDGFLRSVYPNVNRTVPRLLRTSIAFTADYKRFSYDGYGPSTLEDLLNSGRTLTDSEQLRARRLIACIVENNLSKYNHQPIDESVDIGRKGVPKVLIVDQTVGDWSIQKGIRPPYVFHEMLLAAIKENPEADIIIKTHPDMIIRGKTSGAKSTGHYTLEQIKEAQEKHKAIYIVNRDINPISLLKAVDKVYVFSSHMGFEALMCNKEVVIFGMPFYAGWGVGDVREIDRKEFRRRSKTRTVEELFYFAYVLYTKYFHPIRLEYMEIEEAIQFLLDHREYVRIAGKDTSQMIFPEAHDGPVNIAFSFDANYYRQATVTMASLLASANPNTHYSIYCLIAADVTVKLRNEVEKVLRRVSDNFTIHFVDCAVSDDCFEIRGITKVTYFRLLLPDLLPNIEKIIYSDVDIIFRDDLSSLFAYDIGNHLFGACIDISLNAKSRFNHFIKKDPVWRKEFTNRRGTYMHAGFLLMNLKAIRNSGVTAKWNEMLSNNYHFQDMDIINITCKDRFYIIPPYYCHLPNDIKFKWYIEAIDSHLISANDVAKYLADPVVVHFAGEKPWNDKTVPKGELWWKSMEKNTPYKNYFKWRYVHLDLVP